MRDREGGRFVPSRGVGGDVEKEKYEEDGDNKPSCGGPHSAQAPPDERGATAWGEGTGAGN